MAVRLDPLPARRRWRGQRQLENGNHLAFPSATADRHDLVGIVEIYTFDTDRDAEGRCRKRAGEVLFQHREESDALFGLAVGIYDRFFHQCCQSTGAEPLPEAAVRCARRLPPFRPSHQVRVADGLRGGALREGLGPASWCELPDQPLRVRGDADQDVLEIVERRDVDERATLEDGSD